MTIGLDTPTADIPPGEDNTVYCVAPYDPVNETDAEPELASPAVAIALVGGDGANVADTDSDEDVPAALLAVTEKV